MFGWPIGWPTLVKIGVWLLNFFMRRKAVQEGKADAKDSINRVADDRIARAKRARDRVSE